MGSVLDMKTGWTHVWELHEYRVAELEQLVLFLQWPRMLSPRQDRHLPPRQNWHGGKCGSFAGPMRRRGSALGQRVRLQGS